MGELYDEYLKKRKKNKKQIAEEWNQENPDQKISSDDLAPVRTKSKDDDLAPVAASAKRNTNTSVRGRTKATTKQTVAERSRKDPKKSSSTFKEFVSGYLDKGGLDEDVTAANIAKSILGTGEKLVKSGVRGVLGGAESVLDLGTFAIGKGAETVGFDEFAKKAYNFQQRDLMDETNAEERVLDKLLMRSPLQAVNQVTKYVDEDRYSFTGEKLDALTESAGQMGAVVGLQAVGVPWFVTTGTMGMGQGATEALKEGATSNEAAAYGAVSAGSEVLFEKLSGGIKLGGKTVGDHLVKPLVDKISNKTLKTLVKYGIGATGEGAEEVLTEITTNIGKKLTYEDEKTWRELLTSEQAMESYLDAFIGGAVISGGFNVGRLGKSLKTGRDYDTGLSADEDAVVKEIVKKKTGERQKEIAIDEEVNRRIANIEKGTSLTTAEKRNIRKTVMEEIESGELELDYSKTKVSGKETSAITDEVMEDLKKGYVNMDDIENMFAGEEFEQIKSLMSELKKNPTSERKDEIEAKMDEIKGAAEGKMSELLKNSPYFSESYRQRLLKGESFTRDEQDTDTEITKELAESAKAAGMNNTGRMHDLFEYTNKIANDTSTKYGFTNSKQLKEMGYTAKDATINGMVRVQEDGTTKVLINVDSKKALNTIIGHETTHLFEGTKEHAELVEAVKEYAVMKGEYDSRFKAVQELYKNVDANIENEVTADLVGDYIFTDEQFIQELTKKPNVFQKVYDYIKHVYKMATAGSVEARQLQKAKRAFEKAYKQIDRAKTSGYENTKTRYDISEDAALYKFIEDSLAGRLSKKRFHKISEKISDRLANDIEKIVGFSVKDYGNEIAPGNIKHIDKEHGAKGTTDHSMGDLHDLAKIGYAIEHYSKIREGKGSYEFKNKDGSPAKTVELQAKIDDEFYYVVEAVPDAKLKTLHVVSAYKNKKDTFSEEAVPKGPSRYVQDEPQSNVSSNDIISQNNTKSNENSENNEVSTFSLSAPVEETKDLVALHNLTPEKLLKTLDLGGMPMPSVAITKAEEIDHSNFGEISLILNKESIDPKKSKYNKVFSGDAYTPTFPQVAYAVNEEVAERVTGKVRSLYDTLPDFYQRSVKRLLDSDNIEETLNREGGEQSFIEKNLNDYGVKQLYLADKGEVVPVEMKRTETEISDYDREEFQYYIEKLGEEAIQSSKAPGVRGRDWFNQYGAQVKDAFFDLLVTDGISAEEARRVVDAQPGLYWVNRARNAASFIQNGGVTVKEEPDYSGTQAKIDEKIANSDFSQWVKDLFQGIVGYAGIRNNKDQFTPSGTRRSFTSLHDPLTLDNIVKAMRGEEQQKGQGALGLGNLKGASAQEFKSIKDIKSNANRLGTLTEEEQKANQDYVSDTLMDLSRRYASGKDIFDARNALVEAVANNESKSGITKYLKQFDFVYKYDESIVDELIELRDYIRSQPTPYFEAKPRRAVSLDEVGVFVIPNNLDAALKSRLLEAGYSIAEYNPEIEGDRQKVVNKFEEYKFSLSGRDDLAPVGGYAVYGKDVKVDGEIAPISEKAIKKPAAGTEDIAPIATNDVEDIDPTMFDPWPDKPAAEPIADYEGTTVPMDTESMRLLTKNMKEVLGLNPMQRRVLKDIIQDYSTGKIATGDDLYNAIADQFSVQSYEVINEELTAVKKALRETPIHVSDSVKDGMTNYYKFRQSNFGKLKLGNNGLEIDDAYEALREVYPGHFPEDITNIEDQLYHMEEVANMESSSKEEYVLPEERIAEATDFIRESVSDYKRVKKLDASLKWKNPDGTLTRAAVHAGYMQNIKDAFTEKGMDFESVLEHGKRMKAFSTVNNTPQRVMEKTFGYKEGQMLSDLTVNKAAENETEAIKWLNSFTNKKNGTLAKLSKKYNIKPFSKEDAAAQKYAEGMHVNQYGDYVEYGDRQLEDEIKDPKMRANIKAFVADPQLRKIYDETLDAINASRTRNGYAPIPRRNDYFLHFREMDDTFSKIGIPFNPNDIKAKDLPTDINGMTADNKPGQPWFGSSMQRKGVGTTYSLLGGLEKYLTAAKPQIYHIDDIQVLRALRNYIADTYGQAKGLESLDEMSDEEAEVRIKQVYDGHLSNFARFLIEEANIMAGKTAMVDRAFEHYFERRGLEFMNTLNSQVAKNMIGFNVSSSLTNFVSVTQAAAKASKYDVIKAFAQTTSNKLKSITGEGDGFAEKNSAIVRRKGQDKFYKKWWEKASDTGFLFMSAIDDISTEFIVRTKYNELTRKGMSEEQAHDEAGKWAMRILGDRSFGQMPQIFNSKTLGLVTKFQLEVRNQLDSMFYDTIQEANTSTEEIQNKTARNAVKAAKITSTVVQLAVFQHLFGKAFESVAGYNPTFDIIENLMTLFGFDDEEDSEDTFGDNLEQALLGLGEDLPYFSALTGGRIPIEAALPIEQLVQGKDDYGNDKPRLETLGEALPYYVMPTGYGQIKKSAAGLKMFDKDLPIAGSYTDSGNLRFPVAPTPQNIAQAAVFGQWANENAREYFDGEHQPLKEKQIEEFKDLDLPIADYWKIREGMSGKKKAEEKLDYIDSLDLPISKKNILANNVLDRKEDIDMTNYSDFDSLEEMDFAVKNPGKYSVSKAVGGYASYKTYNKALGEIKADKDSEGKSIRNSRKEKVARYINSLDADYGTKIILYKQEYPSDNSYNADIINYLNERGDINYEEMKQVLEELGFTVYADGNVGW